MNGFTKTMDKMKPKFEKIDFQRRRLKMTTNIEKIRELTCEELAKLITKLDMFCSMCAYDLHTCKRKCVAGHEVWLSQEYKGKNEKEKLPRGRGEKYGLFK